MSEVTLRVSMISSILKMGFQIYILWVFFVFWFFCIYMEEVKDVGERYKKITEL